MIVVEDLKEGDEAWFSNCGIGCTEKFVFKALERKKKITITCPKCRSKTTIRHMANGKTSRVWRRGE